MNFIIHAEMVFLLVFLAPLLPLLWYCAKEGVQERDPVMAVLGIVFLPVVFLVVCLLAAKLMWGLIL